MVALSFFPVPLRPDEDGVLFACGAASGLGSEAVATFAERTDDLLGHVIEHRNDVVGTQLFALATPRFDFAADRVLGLGLWLRQRRAIRRNRLRTRQQEGLTRIRSFFDRAPRHLLGQPRSLSSQIGQKATNAALQCGLFFRLGLREQLFIAPDQRWNQRTGSVLLGTLSAFDGGGNHVLYVENIVFELLDD